MSLYLRWLAYQVQTLFFDFLEDFLKLNSITLRIQKSLTVICTLIMLENLKDTTLRSINCRKPLRIATCTEVTTCIHTQAGMKTHYQKLDTHIIVILCTL